MPPRRPSLKLRLQTANRLLQYFCTDATRTTALVDLTTSSDEYFGERGEVIDFTPSHRLKIDIPLRDGTSVVVVRHPKNLDVVFYPPCEHIFLDDE